MSNIKHHVLICLKLEYLMVTYFKSYPNVFKLDLLSAYDDILLFVGL